MLAVTQVGQRIGLDLDNTIIDYRAVFLQIAASRGLCKPNFKGDKTELRALIRSQTDGDWRWTELQALVYGPGLANAAPGVGALAFVQTCIARNIPLFIVSHKTRFAAADPNGVNLHEAARDWLERHNFVGPKGLSHEAVFFEPTRSAKLARIARLGCSCFVDDLREVFEDSEFPEQVERLLLSKAAEPTRAFHVAKDWNAVASHVFGGMYCE